MILWRAALLYRSDPQAVLDLLGPSGRILAVWHALPLALWFLVPDAIGRFVWFIGPTHVGSGAATLGAAWTYDPLAALAFHWQGFSQGFHGNPVVAALVLAFALVGAAHCMRIDAQARILPIFAGLCVAAVVLHPQQQWRFQATFLFALWALSAIGAARFIALMTGPMTSSRKPEPGGLLLVVAAGFVALQAAHAGLSDMALRVAIRTPQAMSDRILAATYLDTGAAHEDILIASSFGDSALFGWTMALACRCRPSITQPVLHHLALARRYVRPRRHSLPKAGDPCRFC